MYNNYTLFKIYRNIYDKISSFLEYNRLINANNNVDLLRNFIDECLAEYFPKYELLNIFLNNGAVFFSFLIFDDEHVISSFINIDGDESNLSMEVSRMSNSSFKRGDFIFKHGKTYKILDILENTAKVVEIINDAETDNIIKDFNTSNAQKIDSRKKLNEWINE